MSKTDADSPTSSHFVAFLLIGLAGVAVALGLWDLVIEQDGDWMDSALPILTGLVVGAIGWQRWRA